MNSLVVPERMRNEISAVSFIDGSHGCASRTAFVLELIAPISIIKQILSAGRRKSFLPQVFPRTDGRFHCLRHVQYPGDFPVYRAFTFKPQRFGRFLRAAPAIYKKASLNEAFPARRAAISLLFRGPDMSG